MQISKRFIKSLLTSTGWWLGVAISLVVHILVTQMVNNKSRTYLDYQANNAQLAIQNRVQSYLDVLGGLAALFNTSDHITRDQFHSYVMKLRLEKSFPGILSLNFAQRVLAQNKSAFEAAVRTDISLNPHGYPAFAIKPAGVRPEYQVLTYLEPMEAASFGLDFLSNPRSAKWFDVARDDGQPISSGRLIHVNGPHRYIGLAVRIPIYRRGARLVTVADRRAALVGSVGAGYDIGKLMLGAVDQSTLKHMRIRVFDTGSINEKLDTGTSNLDHLLFDSAVLPDANPESGPPESASDFFVKRVSMEVGRRVWEIAFSAPRAASLDSFDRYLPWLVLASGLIGSLLLYSIYYSLMSARRHAVELAREMTRDLRNSEASLAEAQHMAHLGGWRLDPASGRMTWSTETYRILGVEHFADTPLYEDFLRRVHEDDRQRIREGLDGVAGSGTEFDAEHRIRQHDGSVRWVHTVARTRHDDYNTLVRGIVMDITERKQTVEALKRSQELLRDLTAYQDRLKEDERKRIAREIHDELGQTLLALRIDVSMLDARTTRNHPRLNHRVRGALQHIDATVKTIRTIINNLRPAVLDLGLSAAIEWQVKEFRRRSGIACDLVIEENELAINDALATSLFRILQESLTNVIRHANATQVRVELYRESGRLVMKITDNGIGIPPDHRKTANAFGLVGVEERILALDGAFTIASEPGKGTTLTVYIPLETADGNSTHQHA
jgi:signal transduction histidine kinase